MKSYFIIFLCKFFFKVTLKPTLEEKQIVKSEILERHELIYKMKSIQKIKNLKKLLILKLLKNTF